MGETAHFSDDFADAFEAALARFQVRVEKACTSGEDWATGAAAAIRAALEFAAEDPAAANTLTNEAMAAGLDGIARRERLLAHTGDALARGRAERPEAEDLPEMTEHALVGGIAALIADRVARGRADELPGMAAEAIQFALTPYLGIAEAKRIAAGEAPQRPH
jgi:DNA-binding PucR family transcriptional regulator